jgi:hypothetical protein
LQALEELGIDAFELFLLTAQQLAKYLNDADVRRLVVPHDSRGIDRLSVHIALSREAILDAAEVLASPPLEEMGSAPVEEADFVRLERRRLERAKELHCRGAENRILPALTEGEQERQSAELHRRHLKRTHELEEQGRRFRLGGK